jgi:hypothetical protein
MSDGNAKTVNITPKELPGSEVAMNSRSSGDSQSDAL